MSLSPRMGADEVTKAHGQSPRQSIVLPSDFNQPVLLNYLSWPSLFILELKLEELGLPGPYLNLPASSSH